MMHTKMPKNLFEHLSSLETTFMAIFWNKVLERFNKVSEYLQKEDIELGTAEKFFLFLTKSNAYQSGHLASINIK